MKQQPGSRLLAVPCRLQPAAAPPPSPARRPPPSAAANSPAAHPPSATRQLAGRTSSVANSPATSPPPAEAMMNLEGPKGDEPDYHPEELKGQEREMQLYIVPPDPSRSRNKRAKSRAKQSIEDESWPTEEQPQHTASSSTTSRLKSKVWLDFTKISKYGDPKIIARCNHCKEEFPGQSKNGTSHLLRHTEAKQRKFYTAASTIYNLEESRRLKPDMPIR